MKRKKIIVYTANIGEHDPPRENTDGLLVFTADIFKNPLTTARWYKTSSDLFHSDWTIWIDANVFLNVSPEELVDKCEDRDFGVFSHFHRNTIAQEAEAVVSGGYDTRENVTGILKEWDGASGLAQTMVLVRKNNEANSQRNNRWWELMSMHSFRDQLSFPMCYSPPYWESIDFTKENKYFTRRDGVYVK